jgi:GNAT superfamily N-acetyltransferase
MPRASGSFLEGIWVIKPYRRQGVGFASVKTIKQTFRSRELQSFVHQRTSKTPFRIRLIRAGSLMKQIALCFFEQRWFEKAVDAKKPAPLMQVQD